VTWRNGWGRLEVGVFVFEQREDGFLAGLVSSCLTRQF
jgi:hypothetical protein